MKTTPAGTPTQRRARVWSAALAAAAFVVVGCTINDDPAPDTTPTTPPPATQPSTPTSEPSEPDVTGTTHRQNPTDTTPPAEPTAGVDLHNFTTQPQQSENFPDPQGPTQSLYATDVRAATHEDYDRIVIDHDGTGLPGFHAEYTTTAAAPGSGLPAELDAPVYLQINATGMAGPDELNQINPGTNEQIYQDLNSGVVTGVVTYLPWEATSTYYIGLDQERPYQITTMEEPTRIVIDIATEEH